MEVEGSTVASVRDASFLKKDAIVDDKFNNDAVEAAPASDTKHVEAAIKKSEADCSSTVDTSSILDKISEEKDDLLEQIEEVCNDKTSDLKNSEEISKTSEQEFLKEIEEIERDDSQVTATAGVEEKPNVVAVEAKAKNVFECETSAIDAVIVGDRVLLVKEDDDPIETCNQSPLATSSEDVKESATVAIAEEKDKSASHTTTPNKDATVSSSTTKLEDELATDQTSKQNDLPGEVTSELVESTVKQSLVDEVEDALECKTTTSDLKETVEEKMEVDNEAITESDKSDAMEVDIKEPSSQNGVEILPAANTDNEALNTDDIAVKNESEGLVDVDMKETTDTLEKQQHKSDEKPSPSLKTLPEESVHDQPEPVSVVNHNDDETKKTDEIAVVESTKPENKNLLDLKIKENIVSSSLTNTPVSSSNVFNSTPIQKQFEISSENVSKISDAVELSHTDKEDEPISTKPLTKSFEDSTTDSGTCATSETDQPTSDGTMKKYINAIKKYNGMPDTTTDEEDTTTPAKTQKINEKFEIKISNLSGTDLKKDSAYEVNVCCDQNDVRYLSIERVDLSSIKNKSHLDKASTSESSVQSSSNGSVTSLPAYPLPQTAETPTSASTSSSTNCHSLTTSQNKHTILGIEELCNFMINQFTKIKHAVNPESATSTAATEGNILTPTQQIKKNKKNSPLMETPSTSASKSKRGRKRSLQEDDVEGTPNAKQAKRDISKETPKGDETADSEDLKSGPCVLAKWVDKKFYAGKITAEKPGNKYVVLFEDGASKTLPKESIVFGEGDMLPLQDQQVYALVEEDYENGIVLSIEKSSNKVVYTVKTDKTTVKVTASDIYLEVDQAKKIQKLQNIKVGDCVEEEESFGTRPSRNKRPPASPSTPEAGYSGAVGKRGGKRQKRLPQYSVPVKRVSESSDSSDTLESTPPVSPKEKAGLELVEGVQPELQNSSNDSELSRMIFISDYKKSQPNCDVDELLGPLPKSNTLFRNKHFLLTCTVGLRPHRYHQEKADNIENNRFKQFSAVPYIKHHIQRQLEAGGAKIYNYFEDVPKSKYKQCKLIAPRPCLTAKYVQCLSSDIQAITHDWVIDSCRQNKLSDFSKYQLPAGWSIITEKFVEWKTGKNNLARLSAQPFTKTYVLIAGQHSDFVELWGRVCKASGAKLRLIKSLDDITPTTVGYMVAESDFSHAIKAKAQFYGIPVVSTVWIVQSLINGAICPPNNNPKLTQLFEDDEI